MNTAKSPEVVIASFETYLDAKAYVESLQEAGFTHEQVGILVLEERAILNTPTEEGMAVGAVTGGLLGALTGVSATLLVPGVGPLLVAGGVLAGLATGAGTGAAAGGLFGELIQLGIEDSQAQRYVEELYAGRTLVVIQAGERNAEAIVLRQKEEWE